MRRAADSKEYDISALKEFERDSRRPFARRLAYALLPFSYLGLYFDALVLLVWLLGYSLCVILWHWYLMRLPDHLSRRAYGGFLGISALYQLSFAIVFLFLFSHEARVVQAAGYLTLYVACLASLGYRSRGTVLAQADLFLLALIGTIPPYFSWWRGEDKLVIVGYVLISLHYFVIYYWAQREVTQYRARQARIREAEAQRDKLQALGQLTGGVAHDFNNLLTVILGNLELQRELEDPDEKEALGIEVEEAAKRAAALTGQLLTYSRRSTLEPDVVDPTEVLETVSVLIKRLLPATHKVIFKLGDNVPLIRVDRSKFETTIVNMVVNARDAMPDGGSVKIRAKPWTLGTNRAATEPAILPNGHYLRLMIEDSGTGIPDDILGRVLEPYFTTKPVGQGSGLGLPMALGFAEQSGGALTFETKPGKGTTVSLWFPQTEPLDPPKETAK